MSAALILYGSRARGEYRASSDVDLILADDGLSLGKPANVNGVSVHLYSKDWLASEAAAGSLFVYHVAYEGVFLRDDDNFRSRLTGAFCKKKSYRDEVVVAGLVLRFLLERDWQGNYEARRRYFWALRTFIISLAAERDCFIFSSIALEASVKIEGLAAHIDLRDFATFGACDEFGRKVLELGTPLPNWHGAVLREKLLGMGGIALDSVRVLEEQEAIGVQGASTYI